MKRFFFKCCLGYPKGTEENIITCPTNNGGICIDSDDYDKFNGFIVAVEIIDIYKIRYIKKQKEQVQKILELIKQEQEEKKLYLALVSIIKDYKSKTSNQILKKFIMELLYFDCKTKVNNTMLKIVRRANCILKDDSCYKSDVLHAYLVTFN